MTDPTSEPDGYQVPFDLQTELDAWRRGHPTKSLTITPHIATIPTTRRGEPQRTTRVIRCGEG